MDRQNCTWCRNFVKMDGKVNAKNGLCRFWETPVDHTMMCPKFESIEEKDES